MVAHGHFQVNGRKVSVPSFLVKVGDAIALRGHSKLQARVDDNLNAGRKLSGPQVGAIAVMKHHVGIVKEVHGAHVTLVSGNNSGRSGARKVGVSKYAKGRVMAYVWPE